MNTYNRDLARATGARRCPASNSMPTATTDAWCLPSRTLEGYVPADVLLRLHDLDGVLSASLVFQ